MAIIQYSALHCNKIHDKVIKVCAPTIRKFGQSVKITVETVSEPNPDYIKELVTLLENTPISTNEYFANVKCVEIRD